MTTTQELLRQYIENNDPLSERVEPDEVPVLIHALRARLGAPEKDLDLSPSSLRRLEARLLQAHQDRNSDGQHLSEQEAIRLVRELVAYLGEVLVRHAEGQWEPRYTLWDTAVVFHRPTEVAKGGERRSYASLTFFLGDLVASIVDAVEAGKSPDLHSYYTRARSRRHREKL